MVEAGEIPNAQVLIARRGRIVADVTLGQRDVERGAALPADAVFRLYSMTKPLTSVAIMMLADEGRLSLDDPVGRFLPAFAATRVYASGAGDDIVTVAAKRAITIRDLMTHSGGLTYQFMGDGPVQRYYRRHGVWRDSAVGRQPGDAPPARYLDDLVARLAQAPLLHQPGERFSYSYSTAVLGKVVELASGETLDAFMKRRLFVPLDMRDTGFVVTDAQVPRMVALYRATPGGIALIETAETSEYRDPARLRDGGGALASTARDYLNFAEMLANGGTWHGRRLLKRETIAMMMRPALRTGGTGLEDSWFGLGFAIGDARSEAIGGLPVGTASWGGSGNTYFLVDPARGIAAVAMTNILMSGARTEAFRKLVNRAVVDLRR